MARKPRIEFAGAVYHVMSRGDRGEAIIRDERDRVWLLGAQRKGKGNKERDTPFPEHILIWSRAKACDCFPVGQFIILDSEQQRAQARATPPLSGPHHATDSPQPGGRAGRGASDGRRNGSGGERHTCQSAGRSLAWVARWNMW
jgi:hypothetical protein